MVHAEPVQTYDAIIIGGGPAGSTCARFLTRSGARVVILDRNRFPRVKLCAGWLSRPVCDVMEIAPDRYPRGLWPWERCHVHYGERRYTIAARGYFIRRYEFDDYLLRSSGADIVEGHSVRDMVRDGDRWVIDGRYAAPVLIGAGGTHCPVARTLFDGVGARAGRRPVGVQEHEFSCESAAVARHLSGRDGEPELLLHGDLRGYSWNIPKTDWINIGCGTINPREVRAAWTRARDYFEDQGQVPPQAQAALDHMKGHSYYLFHDEHLDHAARPDGAYLVGDALGLAQPLTAEGILPAILSGRLCAEAVAAGAPERYGPLLRDHP
ncbi:MAG: NAD(P)/FAD-dependent oxidoreductase, partial [Myxococcota bacterium]